MGVSKPSNILNAPSSLKSPSNIEVLVKGIDTKELSSFIINLNITRRNCHSYPDGHPVIESSLKKTLACYNALMLTREEIILGVTRDALLLENVFIDKSNPIYQDFAGVLFDKGIGALVLHRGLTINELRDVTSILNIKRDDIYQNGGIEAIWGQRHIDALSVWPICIDLFNTVEIDSNYLEETQLSSEGLWERFVRGLTQKIINPEGSSENINDPELLAAIINQHYALNDEKSLDYANSIIVSAQQNGGLQTTANPTNYFPIEKLASFVDNMNPTLRSQFLCNAFNMKTANNKVVAEEIIGHLTPETILETLEEVNQSMVGIPPLVMGLLQKLARPRSSENVETECEETDQKEFHDKMQTIFREHITETFMPSEYQQKLDRLFKNDEVPFLGSESVSECIDTLDVTSIESCTFDVLSFLIINNPDSDNCEMLIDGIHDISDYFLKIGDYSQVIRILQRIKHDEFPDDVRVKLLNQFSETSFINEVMSGLRTWGKTKYHEIRVIIQEVGKSFLETLLDSLAEEESMSLRRFLMDRIQEFGLAASPAVSARLCDLRWYFVRNLVIIIRTINDPILLKNIRPMLNHPDQRVRQEVFRTLLHHNDPAAEWQILSELDSSEHENIMSAISLSGRSTSKKIFDKLIKIATKSGFSSAEYELRNAAIQTLAEIGNSDALPHLSKILSSRNLLRPSLLNRLKLDVIRSIERYPTHIAQPFLEHYSLGKDEVAQQAATSLGNMSGQ